MQRLGLPNREGLRVSVANPVQETALVDNNKPNEPIGSGAASAPTSDNLVRHANVCTVFGRGRSAMQ